MTRVYQRKKPNVTFERKQNDEAEGQGISRSMWASKRKTTVPKKIEFDEDVLDVFSDTADADSVNSITWIISVGIILAFLKRDDNEYVGNQLKQKKHKVVSREPKLAQWPKAEKTLR